MTKSCDHARGVERDLCRGTMRHPAIFESRRDYLVREGHPDRHEAPDVSVSARHRRLVSATIETDVRYLPRAGLLYGFFRVNGFETRLSIGSVGPNGRASRLYDESA
jgi:hypothetical protein